MPGWAGTVDPVQSVGSYFGANLEALPGSPTSAMGADNCSAKLGLYLVERVPFHWEERERRERRESAREREKREKRKRRERKGRKEGSEETLERRETEERKRETERE